MLFCLVHIDKMFVESVYNSARLRLIVTICIKTPRGIDEEIATLNGKEHYRVWTSKLLLPLHIFFRNQV
jgi:hypothetical protein